MAGYALLRLHDGSPGIVFGTVGYLRVLAAGMLREGTASAVSVVVTAGFN